MHWIGAAAVICMFLSGWAIYNASPSLPFTFPWGLTLGGWLAGGIAWHISVMWVLFADGLAYPPISPMARYRGIFGATSDPLDRAPCYAALAMRCVSGSLIVSAITMPCNVSFTLQ